MVEAQEVEEEEETWEVEEEEEAWEVEDENRRLGAKTWKVD